MALAATISMRGFLALAITVWLVSRTHIAFIAFPNGSVGFHQLCVAMYAFDNLGRPWQAHFLERNASRDRYYEQSWSSDFIFAGERVWRTPIAAVKYTPTPRGLHDVYVGVTHGTLIAITLLTNVAHLVYCRRKRKADQCGD